MMTSKVFVIFTISLLEVFSAAESDYVDEFLGGQDLPQMRLNYPPALRRRPNQFNDMSSIDFDQEFLDQLVDEQARRRFHKHMEALSRQFNYNLNSRLRDRLSFKNPFPSEGEPSTSYNSPDFEYNLPKASSSNGDIVFGLTPSDSRYKVDEEVESYDNDDFKPQQQHSASPDVAENEQQVLFKFINPQKINNFKTQSIFNPGSVGQDIKTVPHLQRPLAENNNFVMKESMGLESDTNVYVVALIAGVTAAVTVGLIVLVVAWYT
uniref:Uncharacterized protein n=1 Tax=Megaselia scalaris TaxID=36166 RepID=T1GZ56_MEGSC